MKRGTQQVGKTPRNHNITVGHNDGGFDVVIKNSRV
jgi:hypothetical protein